MLILILKYYNRESSVIIPSSSSSVINDDSNTDLQIIIDAFARIANEIQSLGLASISRVEPLLKRTILA